MDQRAEFLVAAQQICDTCQYVCAPIKNVNNCLITIARAQVKNRAFSSLPSKCLSCSTRKLFMHGIDQLQLR